MIDLAKFRMSIRDRIIRTGVGPLRKPAEMLEAYSRFADWVKSHPCDQHFPVRTQLYDHINTSILDDRPIDYLEFGVYKGDSIRYWAELNRRDGSRFFGFDSFEGLPDQWNGRVLGQGAMEKGTFDVGGVFPAISDSRVTFVKGYFQDSLPTFLEGFVPANQLVIHMDADLYTSTLYVLCSLDRLIRTGTVLIFDEFASINHEFRALTDYVTSFRRTYSLLAYTKPNFHQVAIRIN